MKITIKSQFEQLTGFFISLSVCIVLFFLDSHDGSPGSYDYLVICAIIVTSTVLIIHMQYLYVNLGAKVILTNIDQIIYCQRDGSEKIIKHEDVTLVEKYVSYAQVAGGRYILPTDSYYYQKITLLNGDSVIITSLLLSDYELFPDKGKLKKRILALIT